MDGIFLKYICCAAVPLKAFIILMGFIDFFVAILDSFSIYSRSTSIVKEDNSKQKVALILAVVFFSMRLLLYIPTSFYTIKLLFYTSKTGGKILYGLKLAVYILFLIFNVVGLGFLTEDGCTVMHTKLPDLQLYERAKRLQHNQGGIS